MTTAPETVSPAILELRAVRDKLRKDLEMERIAYEGCDWDRNGLRADNARLREALLQVTALDWPGHVTPDAFIHARKLCTAD